MHDTDEIKDLQERFAALPDITLPDSLRAEALFAKLDAGELDAPKPEPKRPVVLEFARRYRAVLSYAAAFAVLVLVYYGAGLDRSLTAAPQMSAAAPSAAASSSAAAPAAAPQMAEYSFDADTSAKAAPEQPLGAMPNASGADENSPEDAPAPRLMTAAAPLAELELGGATALLEQTDNGVRLSLRCADSTDRIFTQQGGYLYMGEVEGAGNRLLLATLTDAVQLPQTGVDSLTDPIAAASISSYPGGNRDQYMVLTVLDTATGTALRETAAVLGSNLILQPLGDGSYVVFSDAQPDATAIASLTLGGAKIELR